MKTKQHILFTLIALFLISSNGFCVSVGVGQFDADQKEFYISNTKHKPEVLQNTKSFADANLAETAFSLHTTRLQPSADNFLKYSPNNILASFHLASLYHNKLEDESSLEFINRYKHLLIFPFHTFI